MAKRKSIEASLFEQAAANAVFTLEQIAACGEQGLVTTEEHIVGLDRNYLEVALVEGGIAVRISAAGLEFLAAQAPKVAQEFEIETFEAIPPKVREAKAGKFPFEKLEIMQGFTVHPSAEIPDPAKYLTSVAARYNRQFAVEVPDKIKLNRKGEAVPKLEFTRVFVMRKNANGSASVIREK